MFSAVLFAQDQAAARALERAATASGQVLINQTLHALPSSYELTKALNSFKPDFIFVELSQFEEALVATREARAICPEAGVIGFAAFCDEEHAQVARKAGVTVVLSSPLTDEKFQQGLREAISLARDEVEENLLAFLPAKGGSGSTTIALNMAGSLARDLRQNVLVVEADLRSGPLSILLKLSPDRSILDALKFDGTPWSGLVVKTQGFDLLPAPRPIEPTVIPWSSYHQLLHAVRRRYDSIVVDLPEVVNDAALELVWRARAVFVVATVELPSLVLARQRHQELRKHGVPEGRIAVILNRWAPNLAKIEDLERFLEVPIAAVFPNDYRSLRRAAQEGRVIERKSELGRSFSAFAVKLAGPAAQPPAPRPGVAFWQSLLARRPHGEPQPAFSYSLRR